MPFRRTLLCRVVFLAVSVNVLGQEFGNRFTALKLALGLSSAQVSQLQKRRSAGDSRPAQDEIALLILDGSQRDRLTAIKNTLDRWDAAAVTIGFGLIEERQWPGGAACLIYQIRAWASLAYASELDLSPFQIERFAQIQLAADAQLWPQIREKAIQRSELLLSGVSADSPELIQLGLDINKLQTQLNTRPRHDLALGVLDEPQKAKLAVLQAKLQAASEAIELGLIPVPVKGEPLCP